MRVRRCDCCGKDIEPLSGILFKAQRHYLRVDFEDIPGKEWHYDLCQRCAKVIEDTIKHGAKEG